MWKRNSNEILTIGEAAAFLRVPKSWLYERTRLNAVPVRRLGRHLRFSAEELRKWFDDQQGSTATDTQARRSKDVLKRGAENGTTCCFNVPAADNHQTD